MAARERTEATSAAGVERSRAARRDARWLYNDQMSAWRPRGAVYDHDVNACVLGKAGE